MRLITKFFSRICLLAGILLIALPLAAQTQDNAASGDSALPAPVYRLTIDGAIGPAFAAYMDGGLTRAEDNGAQAVIIALDTPGGLLTTTREMVTRIIEASIPVIVWVTPSGAHAASAGTFILYASHIAAMDEGTNVGAATPVEMGGNLKPPKRGQIGLPFGPKPDQQDKNTDQDKESGNNTAAMSKKALEDTAAFIRGLAEMRDRNAEWAEKAVTEADSLTAREALEQNVIDLIATSESDLLTKIDGRTITLKNGESVTLETATAPVERLEPDWKTRLMALITDPNVALILMSIGVYGLILEFYNPGTMVPGTIGIVSLVLGLYAMNILPINAAGALLVVLGVVFMIAEAFIPSFGILGFMGVAAFVIGATIMFDTEFMPGLELDPGLIWGIGAFGVFLVTLLVFLTVRTYKQKQTTGTEGMAGRTAKVRTWDGKKGMVLILGELWHAESDKELDLNPDDEVTVERVDNLTLHIRADT